MPGPLSNGHSFTPSRLRAHVASFLCLLGSLLLSSPALSQVATGTPPFSSTAGGPDAINLGNFNLHIDVPVLSKAGRGMPLSYALSYDSSVWYVTGNAWRPVPNWGWRQVSEALTGYVSYNEVLQFTWCDGEEQWISIYNQWAYHDPKGTAHPFPGVTFSSCTNASNQAASTDGSGYSLSATSWDGVLSAKVYTPSGKVIVPPLGSPSGPGTVTDSNGNRFNVNVAGSTSTIYDTLSSTNAALTITGSPMPTQLSYPSPSGTGTVTVTYTAYPIKTNFACSATQYTSTGNVNLLTRIQLADGSHYDFQYEDTMGFSGYKTGRIKSMQLPTGGTVTYTYTGGDGVHNPIVCSDGSTPGLDRVTPDSATPWHYSRSLVSGSKWQTTVTAPNGDVTQMNFQFATPNYYETKRVVNTGASPALQTVQTCYNGSAPDCTATAITLPITRRDVYSQLPSSSGVTAMTRTDYTAGGNVTAIYDYDFGSVGSGSAGALLRKTTTTYITLPSNSLGTTIVVPSQVAIYDGSGVSKSLSNLTYDQGTLTTTSGTPQHISVTGSRGNLTTVATRVDATNNWLTRTFTYHDAGMAKTSVDVNSATTTYNYVNATDTCGNTFPTSITFPSPNVAITQSFAWNCSGGVTTSITDENGKTTSTTYNDPYFWRPARVDFPDGGQTSWTYNSPTSVTTTTKRTSSQNIVTTAILDSMGRTNQTQLNSDPLGVAYLDASYDSLGRVSTVTNPHRSGASFTDGTATYGYDALGRVTSVTLPDGSVSSASYSQNTVTSTDPAGKSRKSVLDGLSRVTKLFENPAGLNYETAYTYDQLGNLISVQQKGGSANSANWRTRTFTYDWLSRMTSETTPEAGTSTYTYNSNGDLATRVAPAPNQTGSATVTTAYTWDSLHRITQKSYSDGTPALYFAYDVAPAWMSDSTNVVGRLANTSNSSGGSTDGKAAAATFSYDSMGRVVRNWQQTPSASPGGYSTYSTYDLAGNLTSATDASGTMISYAYDSASRPTSVTSNWVDANHPATLYTVDPSVGYFPGGALRKATLPNGLTQTAMYNNRLQPCRMEINSTAANFSQCTDATLSGNVLDFSYGFNSGTTNNGNVASWSAVGNQTFTRTYGYDSLNRISTMSDTAASQACKGLSWTIDAWGNLTDQTVTSGTCLQLHVSAGTNNRLLSPYQYDAAGNMTYDGTHSYSYNAEDQLTQVDGGTASYVYDADGRRIRKNSGGAWTEYFYDGAGNVTAEKNSSTWPVKYVYLGDQLIAQYRDNTTYSIFRDHLGSTRLITKLDKSVYDSLDFLPFGAQTAGATGSTHKFTGKERDSESGLDHALFRQYSSQFARWTTPDPAGLLAVSLDNPQTLNQYSYVANMPLSYVDPLGLMPVDCSDLFSAASNAECSAPGVFGGGTRGLPSDGGKHQLCDPNYAKGNEAPGSFLDCVRVGSPAGPNAPTKLGGGGRILQAIKNAVCKALPTGSVTGATGSTGGIGGTPGSVEVVVNYNSGQVSAFTSGGFSAGWNGGAQGNVFTGYVWGLGQDNKNYSGGFTTISGGAGLGGFLSHSSGGVKNPKLSGNVTAAGLSVGGSLITGFTGSVSATNYTQPLNLPTATAALLPSVSGDYLMYLLRRPCN